MNLELTNKVVLITGGTGGIGSQIVIDFLKEGAIVACLLRNKSKLEILYKKIDDLGISSQNLHGFECDLLDFDSLKSVTDEVVEKLKSINVLVNCAGFADEFPFGMLDQNQIDKMIDLNLKSPIYLAHAVLRTMYRQKEGCIINVSSVSAIKKGRGISVYAAAKAGLDTFTRALAIEVGRKNIRVNSIRPGVIDTPMSNALLFRSKDEVNATTALERAGKPSEISAAILFMASNKTASYLTGESITIDGGMY